MKGFKPWLVLALVFFAGIAVGVLGTRAALRRGVTQISRDPNAARERVDSMRDRMEKELVSNLDLNPEQQTNIHQVFVESGEQLRKLRAETEPRMKEIFEKAHQDIAEKLTPEQREKFEKLTKERRERFDKHREKGSGPSYHGERLSPPRENR